MTEYNRNPQSPAEKLITGVFTAREREADATIARLHFERQLSAAPRPHLHLRMGYKLAAFLTALVLLGGWASNLPVPAWDDGQQIMLALPTDFSPASYPYWVALVAKHAQGLEKVGGHSLVVDYRQARDGRYYMVLSLLGVSYAAANDWVRAMTAQVPELSGTAYSITQPLLPYSMTVREMLSYKLGSKAVVERNVLRAWHYAGERPTKNGFIYIIAQPSDYARRVSMVDY
jgi:hypothetical protein